METEDTRIQDPKVAAEEAWEVHKRASLMMGLGEKLPNTKQLEAAYKSIEDMKNELTAVNQVVSELQERLGRLEQAVDGMQDLAEHITGQKL